MNQEIRTTASEGGTEQGIRLRRLELEYELAQTGLKGTLIGILAVILIFGIMLVAVVAYGAFVYRRLVRLFDKLEAGGIVREHDPS